MKKQIYFLVSLLALIGFSSNVIGQNAGTGRAPYIGSLHNYSVTSTGQATSTFAWEVHEGSISGPNVLGTKVTGTSVTNSIDLRWVNPVAGTTYFVMVKENASGGCTNTKAFAVTPKNAFEMNIASLVQSTFSVNNIGTPANYCAADVTVDSWDGVDVSTMEKAQDFNYNYNITYLYYRIEAKGFDFATTGWNPKVTVANTNGTNAAITYKWGTSAPTAIGTLPGSSSFSSGDILSVNANNQYVYIEVAVNNNKTKSPGNEGTTDQAVTLTLTGKDANGNDVTQVNGTVDIADDNALNNIKARPNTSKITTD
jgi:hypothetical protein